MMSFRSKMAKIVDKLKNWATTVRQWWSEITRRGLRGPASRYAGHAALLVVVVLGTWAARVGVRSLPASETIPLVEIDAGGAVSTSQSDLSIEDLPAFEFAGGGMQGVSRTADIHTNIPSRPRMEIVQYLVQTGDSLFGIADKYGLKPESILWGNWEELVGNPHALVPGMELSISPVDGVLHLWTAGESLSGVARYFGVTAEDIIEWPGNELDPTVDVNDPPITAGTALIVPGGRRETPTWRAPRITRANPASAQIVGPGHCGSIYDGPIGAGVFIWPTTAHYISGFNFTPSLGHPAIDIGGSFGNLLFATDAGVIVYAGMNNFGYGNSVVIDHGNGWQSFYAHLDQVNVACGQAVFSGNVVGTMGLTGTTTGPHLHFELMSDIYGKVNPLNFLQ
jgi:murein DD-endopeptidase MepM/ murein hydrolase activator NlpD